MIAADWHLARIALQVLTEERLGRNLRAAMGTEDAAFSKAKKALGG